MPSTQPIRIVLKDLEDLRDLGDHMAELHGELIDAATGKTVDYGCFMVSVQPAFAARSTLVFDAIEPPAPAQQMEQSGTWSAFHEDGLSAGCYVVIAAVPGYALAGERIELREGELRSGLRIALHKQAVVRGKVLDATGQPVVGASLFAVGIGELADAHLAAWSTFKASEQDPSARDPSFTPIAGYTASDGSFVIDQIPPGLPLRLVARHDRKGFVVAPLAALRAGEELADFDLRLPSH